MKVDFKNPTKFNKNKMLFLHFIFPNRCLFCNKIIKYDELCCAECEKNIPYTKAEPILHRTERGNEFFSISPMFYEKGADKAVIGLKFHCCLDYAEKLGQIMAKRLADENLVEMIDMILPVPMSIREKSKRGYNQSLLLAQAVSHRIKRKILQSALLKIKNTKTQHILNAAERRRNLVGAFRVKKSAKPTVFGKTFLLIDDVITTGATVSECVDVLKKAGALEVVVLTATKTRFND